MFYFIVKEWISSVILLCQASCRELVIDNSFSTLVASAFFIENRDMVMLRRFLEESPYFVYNFIKKSALGSNIVL